MNIFIAGASGFVGGAANRRLSAERHRIRAMSRFGVERQKIRAMGAEPVRCDLEMVTAAPSRSRRPVPAPAARCPVASTARLPMADMRMAVAATRDLAMP
ncbi:MAG: hypothetical protein ABSH32_14325 [Bryobacteraceae bacterium]